MKKSLVILFTSLSVVGFSQIPVTDGAMNSQFSAHVLTSRYNEQKRSILEKLRHSETITKLYEQLNTVREALATAKRTKQDIEGMYQLQQDLRNAYQNVKNIEDFSLSDVNFFLKYFLDMDLDPTGYIPNTPYTAKYIENVRKGFGSPSTARRIFMMDNSMINYYNGMIDYGNRFEDRFGSKNIESKYYAQKVDENYAVRAGLEENYGMLMMERFSMIHEEIEKDIKEADRYRLLANDKNAQMTEGERANLIDRSNQIMKSIMELKGEANNIMYQINTFENRPLTKGLFEENQNYITNRKLSEVVYSKINIFR